MKALFRTSLLAAVVSGAFSTAHGQAVANGGFETWADRSGVDAPTGWLTTDDIAFALAGFNISTGTYTKVTDAHSGTYAARLESKSTLLGVVPGALVLGSKIGSNLALPGGLPFTARPTTLQFYYKLSGTQPPVATGFRPGGPDAPRGRQHPGYCHWRASIQHAHGQLRAGPDAPHLHLH